MPPTPPPARPSPALPLPAPRPKVSVIIPVHGVEAYLEQALASVQRQSLREIEIIVVDDASPDASAAIAARAATQDPRIRLLRLPGNIGQGFARNRGLEVARGDYVWFLDGDDWLAEPDFLRQITALADRDCADMTRAGKAGEALFDASGRQTALREDPSERHFTREVAATTFAASPEILHSRHFCLWLYRRSFLDENSIRFLTPQWEERAFLLKALLRARRITLSTCRSFTYRIRPDSTARRPKGAADLENLLRNFEQIAALLVEHGAVARTAPLRRHLEFQLSLFLRILFYGFWYATLRATTSDPAPMLERVRLALESVDFRPDDFSAEPETAPPAELPADAGPMLTAALCARRFDWLGTVVALAAVSQERLYAELLTLPAGPEAAEFQVALNRYATNGRVKPPEAVPVTGPTTGLQTFSRTNPETASASTPNGPSLAPEGAKAPRVAPRATSPAAPSKPPRPRIVLHIGATKTGSTFLQHFLELNRPALLRQGVWVPEVGLYRQPGRPHKQAGHALFLQAALTGDSALRSHLERGLALLAGLGQEVHTILLSSEAFFLHERAPELADYLAGFPLELVLYLRRADEWANSQYCEYVAGGAHDRTHLPIGAWLELPRIRRLLDTPALLEAWAAKLGRGAVHLRSYDRARQAEGGLVGDFAEAVGLPQLVALPHPPRRQHNEARLSSAHVELLRPCNARTFPSPAAYFAFVEEATTALTAWRRARGLPMPPPRMLSAEQAAALMAAQAPARARIGREWFGDAQALDFPPLPPPPPPEPLYPEEIALVEQAWARHGQPESAPEPAPAGVPLPQTPTPATSAPDGAPATPRLVNYGLFGWRLWLLSPVLATLYARRAPAARVAAFRADPQGFAQRHWAVRRPLLTRLLYPNGNPMGPCGVLRLWLRPMRRVLALSNRPDLRAAFERNPILFVRSLRHPLRRLAGRLLFPLGESIVDAPPEARAAAAATHPPRA